MKEFDPWVYLAVFQEMLGLWLWLGLAGIAVLIAALVVLVRRERAVDWRRLVRAELLGLAGGGLALVLMAAVSSSGFTDAGGPADWILIVLVYAAGFAVTTLLGYTVAGWLRPRAAARAGG
jgi:hypothetical protein